MDIFRGLISAGADVNSQNSLPGGLGNTLMHVILRKYSDETSTQGIRETRDLVILLLKVLQSCAADINKKNMVGMTVMDYALHNNRNFGLDEGLVDMLHRWGSKSTFRLLPSAVEDRIGNYNTRQLEWKQPEPERVDARQGGGGLALLWNDMDASTTNEATAEAASTANEGGGRDEEWDDAASEGTMCVDGDNDAESILSRATTAV